MANSSPGGKLEALGFCGADDSVNPRLLALIGQNYPLVEWGILFRPDKEGLPRYASKEWVNRLSQILNKDPAYRGKVRLAAHLCGSHVNNLLSSSTDSSSETAIDEFLVQLYQWGFRRVQVNATAVNGVYTEQLGEGTTMQSFLRTTGAHPKLEFIVQKNDETEPLWSALLRNEELPANAVFLHDESKGTGKEVTGGWPTNPQFVATSRKAVGYAGGIKPANVRSVAESVSQACAASGGNKYWIDMESGIRTMLLHPDGTKEDIFDLAKCYSCIDIMCDAHLMEHPSNLR
mmetsp:Transcript_22021/g.53301  ORF Transcript_22021/g.53301 Transcript_22021/m.53301 type:complete len:290 (-) Transcript_22021:394-1263(-)|eukprot:CAMPEP_0181080634 /NCGR_PEP_ID=MMETSP1071-20121207/2674_1 /TAXON_ID=35127 /ORGANISM="Thalassiosira sp., Strain NH16" /LENGTH=289 /DNA_ID=CAMNT_0023162129 /DNA_START=62 /DNA_END=931 /DNA_ORIENTATION=+